MVLDEAREAFLIIQVGAKVRAHGGCKHRRMRQSGAKRRYGILFVCSAGENMEAEELNQLANTLADLRERASGLRRYL